MESTDVSPGEGRTDSKLGRTVLIVEPLPDQQWKLARMFTVGGYRAIGTSTAVAALALLRSCPVDLVLLSAEGWSDTLGELVSTLRDEAPQARILVMRGKDAIALAPSLTLVERPQRVADVARFATC